MPTLLNEDVLRNVLQEPVHRLADEMLSKELSGRGWTFEEFRKACCFSRDAKWVKKFVLVPFRNEIEYKNGSGWVIWSKGSGSSYQIRAKKACQWMEKNFERIDWEAKL